MLEVKYITFCTAFNVLKYLIMKTFNFEFTEKELSVLRKVLGYRVLDLRMDEITSLRVGMSTKSIRKELLLTDSILSKLS